MVDTVPSQMPGNLSILNLTTIERAILGMLNQLNSGRYLLLLPIGGDSGNVFSETARILCLAVPFNPECGQRYIDAANRLKTGHIHYPLSRGRQRKHLNEPLTDSGVI